MGQRHQVKGCYTTAPASTMYLKPSPVLNQEAPDRFKDAALFNLSNYINYFNLTLVMSLLSVPAAVLWSYRGLLTLDAAAVEPQRRNILRVPLDVENALVVPLARLRLRQVLSQQRDGPHDSSRDIDLGGRKDLRTLLEMRKRRRT